MPPLLNIFFIYIQEYESLLFLELILCIILPLAMQIRLLRNSNTGALTTEILVDVGFNTLSSTNKLKVNRFKSLWSPQPSNDLRDTKVFFIVMTLKKIRNQKTHTKAYNFANSYQNFFTINFFFLTMALTNFVPYLFRSLF